jgi:hypothetical protein
VTAANNPNPDPSPLDVLLYDWWARQTVSGLTLSSAPITRMRSESCAALSSAVAAKTMPKDIFQEAILKFPNKVRSERTEAAECLRQALEDLSPPDFGDLHRRLVKDWSHDVSIFRDAAVRFPMRVFSRDDHSPDSNTKWREQRDAINGRVEHLVRRGNQFVRDVKDRPHEVPQLHYAQMQERAKPGESH